LEKTAPEPLASVTEDGPPMSGQTAEPPDRKALTGGTMIRFASAHLWVHDQDEALAFYVDKLGMEVRSDVTIEEMGGFRWLAVGPAGQPDVSIVLMAAASPPLPDAGAVEQVLDLVGKGQANGIFLTTEDIYADHERLTALGVEFIEPPEEQLYGIDSGFRDPSGNHLRLTQPLPPGEWGSPSRE
jgi:catechol 2,3-dioxygenase-like lactoylglutathione lyase family enzyme